MFKFSLRTVKQLLQKARFLCLCSTALRTPVVQTNVTKIIEFLLLFIYLMITLNFVFNSFTKKLFDNIAILHPWTTDIQWRHKSKKSENCGRYGRQNMLRLYLKLWDWDLIFGRTLQWRQFPHLASVVHGNTLIGSSHQIVKIVYLALIAQLLTLKVF